MNIDEKQLEIYRKMPSHKRLEVAFSLHDFAMKRMVAYYKSLYPDKSDREINILVTKRFLNESAAIL